MPTKRIVWPSKTQVKLSSKFSEKNVSFLLVIF